MRKMRYCFPRFYDKAQCCKCVFTPIRK